MRKETSMIRNLKFLGLALVAALAMSSVVASMASADVITSEKAGVTTLTGKQEGTDVFKVHGGQVNCTTVNYSGSFTTGASNVLVAPTYSGCTFAGLASTIDMNGCQYRVNINAAAGNTTGTVDIVCSAGQEITVTAPSVGTKKCIIHVPGVAGPEPPPKNQGLTGGTGTNVGSGTTRELTLDINITNIVYSQTAGTAETGNCATADNTTGGTYTGTAIVTGSVSGAHVGIFLS
jgi:hypothetical protein